MKTTFNSVRIKYYFHINSFALIGLGPLGNGLIVSHNFDRKGGGGGGVGERSHDGCFGSQCVRASIRKPLSETNFS